MWYKTGTISFTNGSATVTGVGTTWIGNVGIGEAISAPDGTLYEISTINSNTSITLGATYVGTNQTNVAYVVVPTQSYIRDLASQAAALINNYSTLYNSVGQGKFSDGSVAIPAISFSLDQDTGLFRSAANEVTVVANGVAVAKWGTTGLTVLSGSAPIVASKIGPSLTQQHTLPVVASDTVTLNTATQTLTNKTLTNPSFSGTTNNMGTVTTIDINGGTIDGAAIGASVASTGVFTTLTSSGNTTIGGNLVVNGTTTTVNATTTTLDDPVITLGGDTAPTVDDNKDRGIEFRWHNGTTAKIGFFGFDDSTGKFTFIPDATNTGEVFSGTIGAASFGALDCTTLAASGLITANGGATVFDSSFSLKDNTDPTKIAQFAVEGLTAATTRIFALPDLSGTLATTGSGALNAPRNGDLGSAAYADLVSLVQSGVPVTLTAATYAAAASDTWLIINYAGTHTITLPDPVIYAGRCMTVKTLTANTVVSATSNVAPIGSATAGTAILAATAGKWARLVSNGTAWVVMEAN